MSLRKLARRLKGGPGSGHHGHAGRPGKRGGSSGGRGIPLNSNRMKRKLAKAAQKVVDDWQQDEEGFDIEYGCGGVCDKVSWAMSSEITANYDYETYDGGQPGDDHAWLVAHNTRTNEAFGVDINPYVYETGGGYNWRKKPGVKIQPTDVEIWKIDNFDPDEYSENY